MDSTQWYVAVDGQTVGPVSTELLRRGLRNGKVPTSALVCAIGDGEWQAVTAISPFDREVFGRDRTPSARSTPPVDPFASARAVGPRRDNGGHAPVAHRRADVRSGAMAPFGVAHEEPHADALAGENLPSFGLDLPVGPTPAPSAPQPTPIRPAPGSLPPPTAAQLRPPPPPSPAPQGLSPTTVGDERSSLPDVDVTFDTFDDETKPRFFNWQQRIVEYFHDVSSLNLPDEDLLIGSLPTTPKAVLMQQDSMWNLALCVAFGSERLADAAARAFFAAQQDQPAIEGIDWMARTLLSRGFIPSGIPTSAGEHAISVLRRHCPAELRVTLEKTVWD
ncbi:MAG: DUF4339 domain-containing protein [Polyangiaceae bacterium]|nr:DUF4339 domain-containing protein [Polyangiaceae bacterium]